jgi:hypothetical protein
LLLLVKYIYLNPVRAKTVKTLMNISGAVITVMPKNETRKT